MQCYTELTAPTAVTHAVNLPLLGPKANNLVVAKTSLLQIFEFKSITTDVANSASEDAAGRGGDDDFLDGEITLQRTENTTKLVLVGEYALSGTVMGLEGARILDSKSGGKALLVALKDAKLSLLEWDPESYTLVTISTHFYEGEALQMTAWAPEVSRCHNYLMVDPNERCAALKFGQRQLAILPIRQEDLAGDEYDPDLDGLPVEHSNKKRMPNGNAMVNGDATMNGDTEPEQIEAKPTPYGASKVIPLTRLDPTLTHPIHLAFLFEYREPTFGILSSAKAPSNALFQVRKDTLAYSVFTVDIESETYAPILSVSGLPYDLWKVVPLPLPVGGALLVGANEFIHVDQAGKTSAVAVNEFARKCSSFAMSDQAELGLKLEGCTVQQLGAENGDVLVFLDDGELVLVSFKRDGRSVSGLLVHRVVSDKGGLVIRSGPSCTANIGRNRLFVGSEDSDSVILGWTRKVGNILSRKRSHAEMLGREEESEEEDDELEDEDDLYGEDEPAAKRSAPSAPVETATPESYSFRIHDALPNLGPMKDATVSGSGIAASTGRDRAGGLAVMRQNVQPKSIQKHHLPSVQAVWSVFARQGIPEELAALEGGAEQGALASELTHDQYFIASRTAKDGTEDSAVYKITASGVEEYSKGDFERDSGATIEAGTLASGTRIVQVLRGDVRSYDSEFGLDQIILMEDEEAGTEPKILAASFCDPHLLLLRDDSSVIVLEADRSGAIEEIDRGPGVRGTTWLSGCIYKSEQTGNKPLAFLLSADGGLSIFDLASFDHPIWSTGGLDLLPSMITQDFVPRRNTTREAVVEILVADIGDQVAKSPYLIVRTGNDDLLLYQPYHVPSAAQNFVNTSGLRWQKVPHTHVSSFSEDVDEQPQRQTTLRALRNIGGYSTVFQVGTPSCFILREAASVPRVISLDSNTVKSLSSFNTPQCEDGFAFIDADYNLQIGQLPPLAFFGHTGWVTHKVDLGEQVDALAYFAPKNLYAVGTSVKQSFKLPDDDYHHEWSREELSLYPSTDQGILKLYHPEHWSVIDIFALEASEVVLTIKVLNLAVTQDSSKRRPLIVVGTGIMRGEDLPTKGCIYVFDVINVVPEPGRPETGFKLKMLVRDEVRGAVTAVTELGTQGFLFAAQGQKGMVRGLKEDNTLLPTAFMDLNNYVVVAKSLKNTGMALLGDLVKGLWFAGYTVSILPAPCADSSDDLCRKNRSV